MTSRPVPEVPPAEAARATERVLRLTAVLWAAAWLAALAGTFTSDPGIVSSAALTTACLALVALAWCLLAFVHAVPRWVFLSVAAATAIATAATVNLDDALGTPAATLLLTSWLNLGTITTALLLPARTAAWVIGGISGTALAVLALRVVTAPHDGWAWRTTLTAFAYAVAVGMAVRVASMEVRRAAAEADREALRTAAADQHRRQASAHRDEVERVNRLLHDTVINTLGAVRDGLGRQFPESIRARCAADLAQASRADELWPLSESASLGDLVRRIEENARVIGTQAVVTVDGAADTAIDPRIWHAAEGAAHEALLNVAKHTTSRRAMVFVNVAHRDLTVEIVDDGPGWSGEYASTGGIARSILQRTEESGGRVSIDSDPRAGTAVRLCWESTLPASGDAPPTPAGGGRLQVEAEVQSSLRRVVLGAGAWLLAYATVSTAVYMGVNRSAGSVAALLVMAATLLTVARTTRLPVPRWTGPVMAAAIAVVVVLPAQGYSCPTTAPGSWGVDGAAVLVLVACMLGRGWTGPAWAVVGFLVGLLTPLALGAAHSPDCVSSTVLVLVIEVATVLVIYAFRRLLVRTWSNAAELRRQADAVAAELAETAARESARSSRLSWTVTDAGELMRRIADGRADPASRGVMERARNCEVALRSMIALDAASGVLGDAIAVMAADATGTGRRLDVRSGGPVPTPTAAAVAEIRALVDHVVLGCPEGTVVSLGLFSEPGGGLLTLVAPPGVDVAAGRRASGLDVAVELLDGELLVEARWVAAGEGA